MGREGWLESPLYNILILSCAFLAVVSARYILLVHSDLHQALQTSGLTVEWAEKVGAVGLMGKYLYLLEN